MKYEYFIIGHHEVDYCRSKNRLFSARLFEVCKCVVLLSHDVLINLWNQSRHPKLRSTTGKSCI